MATRSTKLRTIAVGLVAFCLIAAACAGDDPAAAPASSAPPVAGTATDEGTGVTADDGTPVPPGLEPPVNPFLADSPWPMAHQGPAQAASSALPGPESADVTVQLTDLRADAGIVRGVAQTSPFLIVSDQRYADEPEGRSVWGASLTDVYKYALVDGEARYVHSQRLRSDPFSIHWNILTLADGRVVVPSPRGADLVEGCATDGPALLVFEDGDEIDSPFACTHHLPALPEDAAMCRGADGEPVGPVEHGYSVTAANVTFTGELVTYFRLPTGPGGEVEHYVAAASPDLSEWVDCVYVSSTPVTNNFAIEPTEDGGSALYVAAAGSIVKVVWDPETGTLERRWERTIPVRSRTGTTPTLVGYGEAALVAVVDAPCAVTNPFTGVIACGDDQSPAQVIAVHRDDEDERVHTVRLPEAIRTVENSPSSRGRQLVVAAYAGYDPDPSVKGVASVAWDPSDEELELVWFNGDVQMNGVTSISEGSNLVYSSGVTDDGAVHLYGIRMWDDDAGAAGEVVVDVEVAPADRVQYAFDQGNSAVITDDRTILWATSEGFALVHEAQP